MKKSYISLIVLVIIVLLAVASFGKSRKAEAPGVESTNTVNKTWTR